VRCGASPRTSCARLDVLLDLGLGYLSPERSTPTLSPGELQRLRLATQVRSNLFGVVYVLDEPSAGLHPADTEALLRALDRLKAAGNSLFVVEHEMDVIRHADWIVDVGPAAGSTAARCSTAALPRACAASTLADRAAPLRRGHRAAPRTRARDGMAAPAGVTRNNLRGLDVDLPAGVFTSVTGRVGLGQVQPGQSGACRARRRRPSATSSPRRSPTRTRPTRWTRRRRHRWAATSPGASAPSKRLVRVDQRPIGRTPRSNLATYTGLFDPVRKLFAATEGRAGATLRRRALLLQRREGPLRPLRGRGLRLVEMLFLPSVYAPCPTCHGTRYNADTLAVKPARPLHRRRARDDRRRRPRLLQDDPLVRRPLDVLHEVGLGYLRLGQPATELSGGEAQRIKLATELQRASAAGRCTSSTSPPRACTPTTWSA
jgi:excinuclease ABC subunit A